MKLQTLKPRVATASTALRVQTLDRQAGATEMPRGRAWMKRRLQIALAHGYRCVDCGRAWQPHLDQIDHEIPREQGGSNDDDNLKPRCNDCHAIKSRREAGMRSVGFR